MHEKYSNWHHLVVASATSYSNHTTDEWGYFRGIVAGRIIQKHISLIANTSVHPAPYPSIILLAWSRMWISWDLPLNIISELCGNHGNVTWEAANRMALKGGQKWNDTARWITSWHWGLWGALFWCDSHTSVLRGVNYREAHTARGKKHLQRYLFVWRWKRKTEEKKFYVYLQLEVMKMQMGTCTHILTATSALLTPAADAQGCARPTVPPRDNAGRNNVTGEAGSSSKSAISAISASVCSAA